jgi:chitinase
VEDGPFVWFWVYKDGVPIIHGTRDTAANIHLLEPETSYVFTVRARDFGMNWSPFSEPLAVTTEASNPDDHTPPTTPTNLNEMHWEDGEIHLTWTQSTDDLAPQWLIRYDIYINGVFDHSLVGSGSTITYIFPGTNTVSIIAVDTAGNQSAPATIEVDL